MTRERRRPSHVAYHEAGHAVGCWALGIPITYATIIPCRDYAGTVKHARGHDAGRVMVVAFAGPAAQRRVPSTIRPRPRRQRRSRLHQRCGRGGVLRPA